jgi:transketolase
MPSRYFMEGISEQGIVGMAAGMAMNGCIPYVNTIATFLTRRCYEQIAIDVCPQELPVRLLANGGGAVYASLGPTHMVLEDIAIMRALPRMTVLCPADAAEMTRAIEATLSLARPRLRPIRQRRRSGYLVMGRRIRFGSSNCNAYGIRRAADLDGNHDVAHAASRRRSRTAGYRCFRRARPQRETPGRTRRLRDGSHARTRGDDRGAFAHRRIGNRGYGHTRRRRHRYSAIAVRFPDAFNGSYGSQDSILEATGLQAPELVNRITSALDTRALRSFHLANQLAD